MKKLVYSLGLVLFAGMLFLYFKYDPELYILFPKCIFHSISGLDCPGCGSQRAVHALLAGNLVKAADYNLLLVASLPLLTYHFGSRAAAFAVKKERTTGFLYHPLTPRIIIAVVLLFWILRNIHIYPFSFLAA